MKNYTAVVGVARAAENDPGSKCVHYDNYVEVLLL